MFHYNLNYELCTSEPKQVRPKLCADSSCGNLALFQLMGTEMFIMNNKNNTMRSTIQLVFINTGAT